MLTYYFSFKNVKIYDRYIGDLTLRNYSNTCENPILFLEE